MTLLDDLRAGAVPRNGRIKRVGPPARFETETDAEEYLTGVFEEHFHVHRRLVGQHWEGRSVIADLVLVPREPWGQGTSYRPLLLEVKRDSGVAAVTRAAAQAVDYAQSAWDVRPLHQYLPDGHLPDTARLCAAVVLSGTYNAGGRLEETFLMQRFLGRMNVLTLGFTWSQGWTVRLSGERIWSQEYGHKRGGWSGKPKTGSR